jgi:hypothetical protein
VFPSPAWKSFASQWIEVTLDFPTGRPSEAYAALARQYQIEGFPTLLALDATGAVKARAVGAVGNADGYIAMLRSKGFEPQRSAR